MKIGVGYRDIEFPRADLSPPRESRALLRAAAPQ